MKVIVKVTAKVMAKVMVKGRAFEVMGHFENPRIALLIERRV
jgi:hypothetical protein